MTKFELGVAKYKAFQHFGPWLYRKVTPEIWRGRHTLLTAVEGRVLAVAENYRSVAALAGFDSIVVSGFFPVENGDTGFDIDFPFTYVRSGWSRVVEDTGFTDSEFDRYVLISQKAAALDYLNSAVEGRNKELFIGNVVYKHKYDQAIKILEGAIQADTTSQYPFVSGYADIVGISLEEAAKRIVFKHEDSQAKLAEIENLRIRYQKLILEETCLANIQTLAASLKAELTQYAQV